MTVLALATSQDAEIMRSISVQAFTNDFEQYGSYPPGIESLDWHTAKIENGHYYKIISDGEVAGGICVTPSSNTELEIKYFLYPVVFKTNELAQPQWN